ncbi:MAG: potassium-transporting ATPase subunit KdpC [Legionellales bacterium]|nr:potassium-transporting ATPase subunit KdpC [Legionellales bacterium]
MLTTTWRLFLLLTIITGYVYPLVITGLAQGVFPWKANGSILLEQGQAVGSKWIGQNFTSDDYFWGRPSVTSNGVYNGLASGGSNLGPSNPVLLDAMNARIAEHHWIQKPIPVDLVTASGSGLDPDISPEAAYYQMERVASARQLSVAQVQALILAHTRGRTLHLFGEPRVNVLQLNLALDALRGGSNATNSV